LTKTDLSTNVMLGLVARRPRLIAAGGALCSVWLLDESLGLRQWELSKHCVKSPSLAKPLVFQIEARTRPPPIGAIDWPAGRVLLQWCLDHLPPRAVVLEIGSGIGTTALGLACANSDEDGIARRIIATDFDDEVLSILRSNAELNGMSDSPCLSIHKWDAALGAASAKALPVPAAAARKLTHVVGSDLVYYGGTDDHWHGEGEGLVSTLSELLRSAPNLEVYLLCVARGPAEVPYNADSSGGGMPPSNALKAEYKDYLSLRYFEQKCAARGLTARREPIPAETIRRVNDSQWLPLRASWWLLGIWESLVLYRVCLEEKGVNRG